MQVDTNPEDIDQGVLEAVRFVAAKAFCPPDDEDGGEFELAMSIAKVVSFEDTVNDDEVGFKAVVMIDGRKLTVTVEDGGQL